MIKYIGPFGVDLYQLEWHNDIETVRTGLYGNIFSNMCHITVGFGCVVFIWIPFFKDLQRII